MEEIITPIDISKLKTTPMLQQYLSIKKQYQNEILFFRMGDFYEMFLEDAVYASKVLDIVLTKRQDQIPMCGVPHHAFYNYVKKILKVGKNVAVCEQTEEPNQATGKIVNRDVIRVLTPGSIFEEELKDSWHATYIAIILQNTAEKKYEILLAEISTGELIYTNSHYKELHSVLESKDIREFLIEQNLLEVFSNHKIQNVVVKNYNENLHSINLELYNNKDIISNNHFLKKLYAKLHLYLKEIAPDLKIQWQKINTYNTDKLMEISHSVSQTLELINRNDSTYNKKNGSLFYILNKNITSQGKRFLEKTILSPLYNIQKIQSRLEVIEFLCNNKELVEKIRQELKNCYDMDRILNYIQNKPQIKHLIQIRESLKCIHAILQILKDIPDSIKVKMYNKMPFPAHTYQLLEKAIVDTNIPNIIDDTRLFSIGYHKELDQLMNINLESQKYLKDFENKERLKYKTSSIRLKYNNMLGFFIETPKNKLKEIPKEYIKRQTLTNLDRYTSDALKKLENTILSSKEKVTLLQKKLFENIIEEILKEIQTVRIVAKFSAYIDFLCSLTVVSIQNNYTKPIIQNSGDLILKESRHPVVEKLFQEEIFVPNDVHINNTDRHLSILTGPNMSGKSTYIRQIAIIQIMAQIGCFVPCSYASIPLVDKIFTRIGAYDMLSKGQSTFFVEMAECADIMKNFTSNSLILLDEVGRGTSTYDGISISRAILEYFNNTKQKPKVLFATHYSELGDLVEPEKGIVGLTVRIIEENNNIIFLRKVEEGITDKSYGVYVAKLAGIPEEVVNNAQQYLNMLEEQGFWEKPSKKSTKNVYKKTPPIRTELQTEITLFDME